MPITDDYPVDATSALRQNVRIRSIYDTVFIEHPGMVHRANAADTPPALGRGLSRDAGDAAGLTPQAGSEKVRRPSASF